jgi:double-stranded uracil-DNA glycosylase
MNAEREDCLPDLLRPGLTVVFCGTGAGLESAQRHAYYAGRGNKFWPMLHSVGLTPIQLAPEQYRDVLQFGIGITDLVKTESGSDRSLSRGAYDVAAFVTKMVDVEPRIIAFNGVRAARECLGPSASVGLQSTRIGRSLVMVLPSTSAAAIKYWNGAPWQALAGLVNSTRT